MYEDNTVKIMQKNAPSFSPTFKGLQTRLRKKLRTMITSGREIGWLKTGWEKFLYFVYLTNIYVALTISQEVASVFQM